MVSAVGAQLLAIITWPAFILPSAARSAPLPRAPPSSPPPLQTFLAKEAPQPRLLCLTVRRSKTTRGFKPSLHIRHPPDASRGASGASHHAHTASAAAAAAATKSYPLKTLTEVGQRQGVGVNVEPIP